MLLVYCGVLRRLTKAGMMEENCTVGCARSKLCFVGLFFMGGGGGCVCVHAHVCLCARVCVCAGMGYRYRFWLSNLATGFSFYMLRNELEFASVVSTSI